jgi:large subunit ribosomal protein L24
MSMAKIKKGDTVKVIAGKDVGAEGKVLSVDKKSGRLIVEGVNIVKKHTKPSMANQNGGIIEQEAAIDASNVMYVHKGKPTRIGFKVEGDKKVYLNIASIACLVLGYYIIVKLIYGDASAAFIEMLIQASTGTADPSAFMNSAFKSLM